MKYDEIIQAVSSLNEKVFFRTADHQSLLEFRTDGTTCVIMFLGHCVWDDNEDPRRWIDGGETQEPLIGFIERECLQVLSRLNGVFGCDE